MKKPTSKIYRTTKPISTTKNMNKNKKWELLILLRKVGRIN